MSYSEKTRTLYQNQLDEIKQAGLYKQERFIHSPQAADIEVEYPSGADLKKVINICANNYLGLSSHPEVLQAAREGLDSRGYGMSSVRFICGTQDIHRQLEQVVSEFLGTEDTILFPSCMDANAGVFEAILTKDDIMISDRLVHASIVDGMRLCSAEHDTYKHADMEHLEKKLQQYQDKRLRVIINDGVYSMEMPPGWTRSSGWQRHMMPWFLWMIRMPPVSLARPGAARTKNVAWWGRSTSSPPRLVKLWVVPRAAVFQAAGNWWRCAAREPARTCFQTPWLRLSSLAS
jgi:hypothetical protein